MRSARAVFEEEVAKGSGAVHHVSYPDGTMVPVPGPAIFAGHPPSPSVSSLGSDGEAILEAVGLDAELIRSLQAAGVFRRTEIDPALTGNAEPVPPHLSHWVQA
jgi:crotonobetainyl-CoA:carnitine CoA-transferase CaiB-like acyl-CoA transferase